jgi:hypothetical protein
MPNWGPWRPDAATPNSGFAVVADGVLPKAAGQALGYGPFPGLIEANGAGALPADPKGNISLRLFDGTHKGFFGTATTIEELAADNTFSSIATGLTLTDGDDWVFDHFGSYLLFTNTAEGIYQYNVETPAGASLISGAPVAKGVFGCNNVVFAYDCDGNNRRFENSGIGDHTAWSSKGANGKTLEDGGALVGGCDLSNGLGVLFQEESARLIQFGVSGSSLYGISKVTEARGCVGGRTVVPISGRVLYISPDGFRDYSPGNIPRAIGDGKVDQWLFDQVAQADLSGIQGVFDPSNNAALWRISSSVLLGYRLTVDEWFTVTVNTTALSRIATSGLLLDNMDADYPLLDSMDDSVPLDSRFWQGSAPTLAALNASLKVASFSGDAVAATLRSSTFNNPNTGIINRATPLSSVSNSTLKLGTSDDLSDALTWGTANTKERDGSVPLRGRGLNIAFEENFPAGATWLEAATGVSHIKSSQGGPR